MRNPYTVLGVDKSADERAIKSAFRKLAKKYHPDQNPDDPKSKERFAEINQAYEIIGDKEKRKRFDRGEIDAEGKEQFAGMGGNPFGEGGPFSARGAKRGGNPFGGSAGFGGAEDILSEMFGSAFGGSARQGSPFGAGGPGMGGQGMGGRPRSGFRQGSPAAADLDIKLNAAITIDELARGKASVILPDGKAVTASIPPGASDGQTIRLKGKGKSVPGMGAGDALVTIRIKAHPDFSVDGENLRTSVKVPLSIAVKGGKVAVSTLDGRVSLAIPAWTDSGKVMRLKGRGLPKKGGGHGDLLVSTVIHLDDDGREDLERLFG